MDLRKPGRWKMNLEEFVNSEMIFGGSVMHLRVHELLSLFTRYHSNNTTSLADI